MGGRGKLGNEPPFLSILIPKGVSMLSTRKTPVLITRRQPGDQHRTRRSLGAARQVLAKFAAAAATTMAVLAALLVGGSSAALAAGGHFVPGATEASWDGVVATVSFREVDVEVEGGVTTISVKVTADVNVVCTQGESTLNIRRSATALDVTDYSISDDGAVAGTARLPLEVRGLLVPGYSCVTRHLSVTAVLEDFWTGATLVHRA